MKLTARHQRLLKRTFLDYQHNADFADNPLIVERASGLHYWDVEGKRYLDGIAGVYAATLGHGHPRVTQAITAQLEKLDGWRLTNDGQRIAKEWTVKDFMAGIDFFARVAELAENENHHPDLHLVGYRDLSIEIWTHAIGGLSENDFILAAKIDALPIEVMSG